MDWGKTQGFTEVENVYLRLSTEQRWRALLCRSCCNVQSGSRAVSFCFSAFWCVLENDNDNCILKVLHCTSLLSKFSVDFPRKGLISPLKDCSQQNLPSSMLKHYISPKPRGNCSLLNPHHRSLNYSEFSKEVSEPNINWAQFSLGSKSREVRAWGRVTAGSMLNHTCCLSQGWIIEHLPWCDTQGKAHMALSGGWAPLLPARLLQGLRRNSGLQTKQQPLCWLQSRLLFATSLVLSSKNRAEDFSDSCSGPHWKSWCKMPDEFTGLLLFNILRGFIITH